jgi:spore coat polysaccharide biosynthesis protein SpsF
LSRVLIAIQARLSSSRLPRKVLADLGGKPLLAQMHRRLQTCKEAYAVVVACPLQDVEPISTACPGIPVYGGPEKDLLTRLVGCAEEYEADILVRATADCPLLPPEMIDHGLRMLAKHKETPLCQNWRPRTHPDGFDFDIWRMEFLSKLSDKLVDLDDREYFAQYCLDREIENTSIQSPDNLSRFRLTVDYPEDLELVRLIHAEMGQKQWGAGKLVGWLMDHPEAVEINAKHVDGKFGEIG